MSRKRKGGAAPSSGLPIKHPKVPKDGGKQCLSCIDEGFLVTRCEAPIARLILAHGAGAPMDSPSMNNLTEALVKHNVEVVRFEFPYMSQRRTLGKKRAPNRMPELIASYEKVISGWCKKQDLPLFIGGKSMGGRVATMMAASTDENLAKQPKQSQGKEEEEEEQAGEELIEHIRGVLCFGYPFHPPGQPQKLRTEHLKHTQVPLCILQGTRDSFGKPAEVESYGLNASSHTIELRKGGGVSLTDFFAKQQAGKGQKNQAKEAKEDKTRMKKNECGLIEVHWAESADHSFTPTKKSGITAETMLNGLALVSRNFIKAHT